MQIQSINSNNNDSKTTLNEKINCQSSEGLLRKNLFQMSILEFAGIAEEKWAEFLLGRTQYNLSYQMRTYYCLNLCPNRQECETSKNYGWVNSDENIYPARFLNVHVVPIRNNPEKYYELFKIH